MTHPNPSNGKFELLLANKLRLKKATLKIIDSKGALISKKTVQIKQGINILKINETKISTGIYYIKVMNKKETIQTVKHRIQ